MNIKFIINDYLLVWNLLYKNSITEQMKNLKQKAFMNYQREYQTIYTDKKSILEDPKNFIPNNDIVYNIIMESNDFLRLKKKVDKERLDMVRIWDKNAKIVDCFFKKTIRLENLDYKCLVINEEFNVQEIKKVSKKEGRIILGRKYDNANHLLIEILYDVLQKELEEKNINDFEIKNAIIELAVLCEFANRLSKATYKRKNDSLMHIKTQIYPYWLMYLGIPKENMVEYMLRDNITFEMDSYAYEKELIHMDIGEFIEFIIRNKRCIFKLDKWTYTDDVI